MSSNTPNMKETEIGKKINTKAVKVFLIIVDLWIKTIKIYLDSRGSLSMFCTFTWQLPIDHPSRYCYGGQFTCLTDSVNTNKLENISLQAFHPLLVCMWNAKRVLAICVTSWIDNNTDGEGERHVLGFENTGKFLWMAMWCVLHFYVDFMEPNNITHTTTRHPMWKKQNLFN